MLKIILTNFCLLLQEWLHTTFNTKRLTLLKPFPHLHQRISYSPTSSSKASTPTSRLSEKATLLQLKMKRTWRLCITITIANLSTLLLSTTKPQVAMKEGSVAATIPLKRELMALRAAKRRS